MTTEEWNAGYDAYMAGKQLSANPYGLFGLGSHALWQQWSDWRAGWSAAREHKTWD